MQTLTTLQTWIQIDNGIVLRFLQEAHLIRTQEAIIRSEQR